MRGHGPVAQLAERRTLNPQVVGSIPTGLTRTPGTSCPLFPNHSGADTFGSYDGLDLHFDPQTGISTVIARFGAEQGIDVHLVEARRRAIERCLIKE